MGTQRYLDHREVAALGAAPVQTVEFRGRVDEYALRRALDLLSVRHPLMRARVSRDERGYLLYATPEHEPKLAVLDIDDPEAASPQLQCGHSWDPEAGVARLVLTRGQDQGSVALQMDHAVVNGPSVIQIFRELWKLYSEVIKGADIQVKPGSLPSAPPQLSGDASHGPLEPLMALPKYGLVEKRIQLNEADSTALIEAAHVHRTSVHALLCGAILVTQRDFGNSSPHPGAPMWCFSSVDLRNRIIRDIGVTDLTLSTRSHVAKLVVGSQVDPIDVGREVKKQIDAAINTERFPILDTIEVAVPSFPTSLERRVASAFVTNVGRIPKFAQPDGMTIIDWGRSWASKSSTISYPCYSACTYNQRLDIYLRCPCPEIFNHDEIGELTKRLALTLQNIARPGWPHS